MSFIPMGFYKAPAGGYTPTDTDAIAYISEVETQGGTLSDTDKEAVDDLYIGLKADSIYTKLKLMYPFMGGTPDSHTINGISPIDVDSTITWQIALTGSANHDSAGITIPAGTEGAGDINDAPSDVLTDIDNASFGWYYSDAVSANGFVIGQSACSVCSGVRFQAYHETNGTSTGQVYSAFGNATFATKNTNPSPPLGMWIGSRTSSTLITLYQNGSSVGTSVESNSGASLNTNSFIFFNADAYPANGNEVRGTFGFLFVGEGLNGTQAGNMNSRISTFLTAIGR